MSNVHKGHRNRVKKEFLKNGLSHFEAHRILELLLYYSIPRSDTNEIGHALMERFGSLSSVFDAPRDLLLETKGIGEESATLIKLMAAISCRYMDDYNTQNNVIDSTDAAKEYVRYKFIGKQMECVYLVCMGTNGRVTFCDRIAEGMPETVDVSPAKIVRAALLANAAKVLLAHNHPNGISLPSRKDLAATGIFFEELRRVDIELFDHVIVAPDGVYSLRENHLLNPNTGR